MSVLRNRDFRLYWSGQAISLCGTWMQVMAQGWVVTSLSSSAATLGALNVVNTLPMLTLSVVGGALADRHEKRRILIVTQAGMMILAFVLAALVFAKVITLWQIFLLSLLLGVVTAFDLPAAQAYPPELVQRSEIQRAVALLQAVFHGSRLVGPALAGVMVAQFGEGSAFLVNGLSFIAVIVTLLMIPDRHRDAETRAGGRRGGLSAGFRYVRYEPLVRSLIALSGLTTALIFPFVAVLMVYYVRHVLHSNAQGMGTLMAFSGVGALAGAVALMLGSDRTVRRWLAVSVGLCCLATLGLSYAHSLPPAAALMLVLAFALSSLMGRIAQTIQHVVPNELRGRVMAVYSMTFTGLMPYAALGLSALADAIGFARMLRICLGAYFVLASVVLMRVPRAAVAVAAAPAAAEPAA